jgi:hypothetical protein
MRSELQPEQDRIAHRQEHATGNGKKYLIKKAVVFSWRPIWHVMAPSGDVVMGSLM